ncbi:DNA modification methylase [Candidatus Poribacteria bacterium]|nr:MAG: DNA modification methylase [Candidatus Poribacteria bacterium]
MGKYSFEDVKKLYYEMEQIKGKEAYRYVSDVLEMAKEPHRRDFLKRNPKGNHQQSWNNFKGNCFEKLLQHIITKSVEPFGLKVVNDKELKKKRLSEQLVAVKRNLVIDYGKYGMHLPDADIVIYNPKKCRVIAVISCKTSLRERIAQTGYWKFKFWENEITKHIQVYLVTADTDNTLTKIEPFKKARAIVEIDLDGVYVLTKENLHESDKVKLFEHFIEDFKQ